MTEWSGVNAVDVVDRRDRSAVGDVLSREVVLPWLVSRVLAIGALVLADSVSGHGLDFDALVDWDGRWYLDIAQQGYGRGPIPAHWMVHDWSRWPFFPLLPSVTRLLSGSGIPAALTIVLINNAAFLLALVGVHRLAGRRMNDEARQLAVWAMVLFPGSITSVMGYSGGLFLAGAIWSFVLVEDESFAIAGIAAVVAAASRPNGIVVLVALLPAVLANQARPAQALAKVSLPSLAFLVGWCVWLWSVTGDALVFFHAKAAWLEKSIVDFVRYPNGSSIVHVVLAAVAVAALIHERTRLPTSWKVLVLVSLAPSLVLGVIGLGRYAAECFPVAMAFGMLLARSGRRAQQIYLMSSAVGLVVMGAFVRHARLVP